MAMPHGWQRPRRSSTAVSRALGRISTHAFLFSMVYGVCCVIYLAFKQTFPEREAAPAIGGLVVGLLIILGAVQISERVAGVGDALAEHAVRVPAAVWIGGCVLTGLLVRLAWLLAFPPVQVSDFATYVGLARRLLDSGVYEAVGGSRAFWPPGLPFSLLPTMAVFGGAWFVPAINNLVLSALTVVAAYMLALRLADGRVARIATALLSIWPNLAFGVGLANKELLSLFIQTVALLAYLETARTTGCRWASGLAFTAGVVLGYGMLTQPSTLLFPVVFLGFELARGSMRRGAIKRLLFLAFGAALVVSPWTIRNYVVLGAFVPVSNTAGMSLYIGNNPKATGGYMQIEIGESEEVAANRVAAQRALAWIREHPGTFLFLAVRKHVLLLGDDSVGAYWTVKRGLNMDGALYLLFKGVSNIFWLVVLVFAFVSLWRHRARVDGGSGPS